MKLIKFEAEEILDKKLNVEMTVGELILATAVIGGTTYKDKACLMRKASPTFNLREKDINKLIEKIEEEEFGDDTYKSLDSITEKVLENRK
ncbi:MAG: hypothetical protein ACRCX8_05140 [Sarcina sp.]